MGRDKAALPAPPFRSLLERQLALLAALAPCERLVSTRTGHELPAFADRNGVTIVRDEGVAGPLGGLVMSLRAARAPRLLVVGIDVAHLDADMLRRVLGAAPDGDENIGVIPRTTASVQPLAALWPRAILRFAEAQLAANDNLSLRALIDRGMAAGLLRVFDVPAWDEWRFVNWNRPSDITPGRTRHDPPQRKLPLVDGSPRSPSRFVT